MKRFLLTILAAGLGIWLATMFVPGVRVSVLSDSSFFGFPLTQSWHIFVILGIILGLLNYFVKPILHIISLPLEIITLGLFSFIINIGLIWILDVIFRELYIPLWLPLIYISLIIWALTLILSKLLIRDN